MDIDEIDLLNELAYDVHSLIQIEIPGLAKVEIVIKSVPRFEINRKIRVPERVVQ